ncbi:hypothetical protein SAMN04487820_103279 [Actinopolyspora mzabensis]|uniref:Uncharacterized protein n=1 Tax=Actinopolyspora mzabensis TaxID=995066 RepID=A0A1G8Y7F7_ACTMZ|nr:DUF6222 family protein [Actinopolyspora mzabensis]SDJ98374.1 hypothetical protein SAMN04487820_103279 [Actinopolyspora mzabensis]
MSEECSRSEEERMAYTRNGNGFLMPGGFTEPARRLARGIRWSDILAEMEREERERNIA